ncbi:MAG: PEP-CTERM sorting domain-containing protein [Rhodospirillaceae bacterium]|jgi:hypothetical protein|nr:PEP-CTERM sorting domain-containing protein [Rhodospirillaceae bacterium]MBT5810873.1 PEP-CTERM sorting domain-containing protein [Rhodospirillaceae bacterium]
MLRSKSRVFHLIIMGLLFVGVTATNKAHALPFDPLSVGLFEGDQFRLAFVTSGSRNARSADIADYNAFVQSQADAGSVTGSLGLTWKVIGSTPDVDAQDNTGTNPVSEVGVPIFTLTGNLIADDNADLWDGSIQSRIGITQDGNLNVILTYTGTNFNGFGLGRQSLGGGDDRDVMSGTTQTGEPVGVEWIQNITIGRDLFAGYYALSEKITVPTANSDTAVSEPAPLALLGVGLVGLACLRRRRQRA